LRYSKTSQSKDIISKRDNWTCHECKSACISYTWNLENRTLYFKSWNCFYTWFCFESSDDDDDDDDEDVVQKKKNNNSPTTTTTYDIKPNTNTYPLQLQLNSKTEGSFTKLLQFISSNNTILAVLTLRGIYVTPKIRIQRNSFLNYEICNITDVPVKYELSPTYQDVKPSTNLIELEPHETCTLDFFETSNRFVDRKFVLTNIKTLSTEIIHVRGEIVRNVVSATPSQIRLPTLTTMRGKGTKKVKTSIRLKMNSASSPIIARLRFRDVPSHVCMEVHPSELVLKPNENSMVDVVVTASLVTSVQRSFRIYGHLDIEIEPEETKTTRRDDDNNVIFVNPKIDISGHVKIISSLSLTPRRVSIIARSGIAVRRQDLTYYWRPRSPSIIVVDDEIPCLQLSRTRVQVLLRNDDSKFPVSYSSIASYLNLKHYAVICETEMLQGRIKIRLEPATGTIQAKEEKVVDLILEREHDENKIEDEVSSEDEEDDEEEEEENGGDEDDEDDVLKGVLVVRSKTLSLHLRVLIEIRHNNTSPLSSPRAMMTLIRKKPEGLVNGLVNNEKDLRIKLDQALERIKYLETLVLALKSSDSLEVHNTEKESEVDKEKEEEEEEEEEWE